MTSERSTEMLHFFTQGVEVLVLGRDIVSHGHGRSIMNMLYNIIHSVYLFWRSRYLHTPSNRKIDAPNIFTMNHFFLSKANKNGYTNAYMYCLETGLHIFKSYGVWTGIAVKRLGILLLFSFSFIFILGCMFTCICVLLSFFVYYFH